MFSDLAVAHGVPVRRWTAIASFSLQTALLAAALVYPLLRLQPLPPVLHPVSLPVIGDFAPIHSQAIVTHSGGPVITAPIIVSSHEISFRPSGPSQQADNPQAPNLNFVGTGGSGPYAGPIVGNYLPPMPTVSRRGSNVRTSVMMEGNLIHRVEPQYPSMARQLHIEGSVVIAAWISREGLIERAQVESGHPLLVHAALDAVRQWRYRPYYLNHEPVEVQTQITVNFIMQK